MYLGIKDKQITLCLARTKWLTMCDPDVFPFPLQNHFLQRLHITTQPVFS